MSFILLVEDDHDDEALTLRALKKNRIMNEVIVTRDGSEALDFIFGTGNHASRDTSEMPQLILMDLKIPKINSLEVLRHLRANERTRLLSVVILTSSNEQQDLIDGYSSGSNSYIRNPVDFIEFIEAVKQVGLYWLVLNQQPPLGDKR